MNNSLTESHKLWIEQCAATEDIRERFGSRNALDYLIDEKLFTFVWAAERYTQFAAELPAFVAEIQRLFSAEEIREYLNHLEHTKYFVETDLGLDDHDEEAAEEPWPENPVGGAEELLRFFRVRELLQA